MGRPTSPGCYRPLELIISTAMARVRLGLRTRPHLCLLLNTVLLVAWLHLQMRIHGACVLKISCCRSPFPGYCLYSWRLLFIAGDQNDHEQIVARRNAYDVVMTTAFDYYEGTDKDILRQP